MQHITKKSMFTGIVRTRPIAITDEQYARWQDGEFIQDVAPHLSADDREFLISGATADEWEAAYAGLT